MGRKTHFSNLVYLAVYLSLSICLSVWMTEMCIQPGINISKIVLIDKGHKASLKQYNYN